MFLRQHERLAEGSAFIHVSNKGVCVQTVNPPAAEDHLSLIHISSYYTEGDTARVFVRRTESSIDYENLETVKNFPEGFQLSLIHISPAKDINFVLSD